MTLQLSGRLILLGNLTLDDEVLIEGKKALVIQASGQGTAPVIIPTPPAGPIDPGVGVKVMMSLNVTVKAKMKPIVVAGSVVMQGNVPTWPGMMLPSVTNKGVLINGIPACVEGDKAAIFPNGSNATITTSGQ
jgi:uncharacterized Zn-binding protein involved in type VI secretion